MNFLTRISLAVCGLFCAIFIVIAINNSFYSVKIPPVANAEIPTIILQDTHKKTCIKNPKISVFMYHYVRAVDPNDTPTTHGLSVTPQNFQSHMTMIRKLADEQKITLMTGENFEKAFIKNCFPDEKIWIFTADDAWVDTAEQLAPIAHKMQIPFIFGVIAESINKRGFVTDVQVIELANNPLFTIASHTSHHFDHTTLSESQEEFEICDSKKTLETLIKKPVNLFIFPLGKIGKNSIKYLEKCGYSLGWSTDYGTDFHGNYEEKYIMNRIRIHHDTSAKFFENLANK